METKIVKHRIIHDNINGFVWTEADAAICIHDKVLLDKVLITIITTETGVKNSALRNEMTPGRVLKIVAATKNLGIRVPTYKEYQQYKVSLILPLLEAIRRKKEAEEWANSTLSTNFIPSFIRHF